MQRRRRWLDTRLLLLHVLHHRQLRLAQLPVRKHPVAAVAVPPLSTKVPHLAAQRVGQGGETARPAPHAGRPMIPRVPAVPCTAAPATGAGPRVEHASTPTAAAAATALPNVGAAAEVGPRAAAVAPDSAARSGAAGGIIATTYWRLLQPGLLCVGRRGSPAAHTSPP